MQTAGRAISRNVKFVGNHIREAGETAGRGIYRAGGYVGNHIGEAGATASRITWRKMQDLNPAAAYRRHVDQILAEEDEVEANQHFDEQTPLIGNRFNSDVYFIKSHL